MRSIQLIILFLLAVSFSGKAQTIEVITQEKSKGEINHLIYSPDGTLIASTSENDPVVELWDIKTGKVLGKLDEHANEVTAVAFNPSGNKVVSASKSGKIIYWDILNWRIIDSLTIEETPIFNIIFKSNEVFYTGDGNGQIKEWNVNDFQSPKSILKVDNAIVQMDIFNTSLVAGTKTGFISVVDINSNMEIINKKLHLGKIIGLKFFNNGKQIISAGVDGQVKFLNINDLSADEQINVKAGSISAFDANSKKNLIAVASKSNTVKIFSFSGDLISEFKTNIDEGKHPIKALALSPTGATVASSNYRITPTITKKIKESIIQVWDLKRGVLFKLLKGEVNPIFSFDFHPTENKLITLGDDRVVSFWNFETADKYGDFKLMEPKREMSPDKEHNLKTGFNLLKMANDIAKGKVPSSNGARDLGVSLLKRAFKEKPIVKYSSQGNYLITKLKGDEIRLYSLRERKPEFIKPLFSYQPNINNFTTSPDEKYLVVLGSGDEAISIINIETGDLIKKISTPTPSGNLGYLYEATSVNFSPDGHYVAVCFNTSKVFVYNTTTWSLVFENILPDNLGYVKGAFVNFSKDGSKMTVNTMQGVKNYSIPSFDFFGTEILTVKGTCVPLDNPSDYAVTINQNQLYFQNVLTGKVIKSKHIRPDEVSRISVNKDGKMGVTLVSGQFILFDPENGQDDILLVANGDNYIFKTYENYYKVSKDGYDLVTFRIGNKTFPFEQFDAVFNRPDLVLKKLNSQDNELINLYKMAYEKRIKKLGLKPTTNISLTDIPECVVNNVIDIPGVTETKTLTVNFEMKDKKGLLTYNLWVNNVPLYGQKGKSIAGKTTYKGTAKVDLVNGLNKIQVSCRNKDGYESLIETFYVEKKGDDSKPNLYIVSIGTSKYKNNKFSLNYPSKDAKDLSALMQSNVNGVYNEVKTKTLTDEQVTVENVLALKSFLNEADVNDVVIVFVAGHGVLDANFDYYFATYDMDFNNPSQRGLAYQKLESIIDGIKAKRKILIMDTCHSGEVDKDEVFFAEEDEQIEDIEFRAVGEAVKVDETKSNPSRVMNELFNDLRKGTGATVISSAGGAEYAMESDEWKNGLFTYCLLMGLKNQKADLNNDQQIELTELQTYVTEKVKALSHGKQIPNSRIQNLELDFRIW
jgi:WD40 repeat protein